MIINCVFIHQGALPRVGVLQKDHLHKQNCHHRLACP